MTATKQVQTEVEAERTRLSPVLQSKWSTRFIWAAIIQGIGAVIVTAPIVAPWVSPSVAMVIAGGSAGTWFTVGYLTYIMVGVIGVAVTALFYYHFEVNQNRPYKGISNYLAGIHLVLMNVGVAVACFLMMYGGYFGGGAMLSTAVGGKGWTAEQAHVNILSALVNPVGYAIAIAGIGILAGGLGFVYNSYRRPTPNLLTK